MRSTGGAWALRPGSPPNCRSPPTASASSWRTSTTQRSTSDLALRNAQASKELRASATSLTTATERLQTTSAAAGAAATALRGVVGRLGDEITGQVADAAARLETSAEAARTELGALQAAGRATLREVGDQVEETLGGLAERVSQATDGLVAAGGGFAAEIGASGGRAARDIGHTYQEAVAAAAVDLEEKMILIGERLNTAAREVRETSREQAESAQAAAAMTDERIRALVETAARDRAEAVARFEALERHLTGLAAMMTAADRLNETLTRTAVPLPTMPDAAPVTEAVIAPVTAPNGRPGDRREADRHTGTATDHPREDLPGPDGPIAEST
ncbi:hypothetical protein [Sphaerisporangium sp. NPDC051011]|uniref:hypothetical protein n=1 Tax=Sphaerisporangium sp. NPDC051011 TaxID=3155792 RepID=UPI0033EE248F